MHKPKVSICIPTYKQIDYLKRALDSLLIQNFANFEIIISDDTPNNDVKRLVLQYNFNGKLKYFKNKRALGSPANWNESIKKARGEYIKILHHDDWFTKNSSLQKFVNMLDNNPSVDFAFSGTSINEILINSYRNHILTNKQLQLLHNDPTILFFGNIIGAPSATIYRRSCIAQYDVKLQWLVDIDFYIQVLINNGTFAYTPEMLICTPNGLPSQVTQSCANNSTIEIFEYIHVFNKIQNITQIPIKQYMHQFIKLFKKHHIYSKHSLENILKNIHFNDSFYNKVIFWARYCRLYKILHYLFI